MEQDILNNLEILWQKLAQKTNLNELNFIALHTPNATIEVYEFVRFLDSRLVLSLSWEDHVNVLEALRRIMVLYVRQGYWK